MKRTLILILLAFFSYISFSQEERELSDYEKYRIEKEKKEHSNDTVYIIDTVYIKDDGETIVNNYYDDTPNIRFRLSFGYSPYWYHSWYDPWYDWHDFYWYNPWYYRYSYRYSPYRYYYHRYYPRYYYHKRPHHRYHASRRYHEYHRPKQQPTVVHRSSRNAVTTPRRTSTTQRSNYTRSYKPTYSEPNQYRKPSYNTRKPTTQNYRRGTYTKPQSRNSTSYKRPSMPSRSTVHRSPSVSRSPSRSSNSSTRSSSTRSSSTYRGTNSRLSSSSRRR